MTDRSRSKQPTGSVRGRVVGGLVGGLTVAALAASTVVGAAPAAADPLTGGDGAAALSTTSVTSVTSMLVGTIWGDNTADAAATAGAGTYQAERDPGSLYSIENAIGARAVWRLRDSSDRQVTGQGVGVALLDTGTAQVPGLDGPDKLSYGPDLSIESNSPQLLDKDTNGHGTHLAGIIAAHDPVTLTRQNIARLDPSVQLGVAPDAELESMKLATTDGSTDVSQVIAGLDWIAQHPVTADGTRIRVVNLAFGTDSVQPYQADPLAAAAENAWKHGIVVVVSGGNDGPTAGRLSDPAIDPYVLAVGASDGQDSVAGWAYPGVASFSSSGTSQRHVDLLAPGRSIVSLRDPGSYVDRSFPQGRVDGDAAGRLFRGSGTSQAAAVTSGAVALLLQAYPDLTPDQVKYVLTQTATPVAAGTAQTAGAGQLDIAAGDGARQGAGHARLASVVPRLAVEAELARLRRSRLDRGRARGHRPARPERRRDLRRGRSAGHAVGPRDVVGGVVHAHRLGRRSVERRRLDGLGLVGRRRLGHRAVGHRPLGHRPLGHRPLGHRAVGHGSVGHGSVGHRPLGRHHLGRGQLELRCHECPAVGLRSAQPRGPAHPRPHPAAVGGRGRGHRPRHARGGELPSRHPVLDGVRGARGDLRPR